MQRLEEKKKLKVGIDSSLNVALFIGDNRIKFGWFPEFLTLYSMYVVGCVVIVLFIFSLLFFLLINDYCLQFISNLKLPDELNQLEGSAM